MNKSRVSADFFGKAKCLGGSPGVTINQNCVWVGQCGLFPVFFAEGFNRQRTISESKYTLFKRKA